MRFVARFYNGYWRLWDLSDSYGPVDATREIGRPWFDRQVECDAAVEWCNAQ